MASKSLNFSMSDTFRNDSLSCDFPMSATSSDALLDEVFVSVWRQALVEAKRVVTVNGETYAVRRTPRHHLAQVDFEFGGQQYRGLEQNPLTKSRWAQMARGGAKVMQCLQHYGRKIAGE
jgi:hypothetical protein